MDPKLGDVTAVAGCAAPFPGTERMPDGGQKLYGLLGADDVHEAVFMAGELRAMHRSCRATNPHGLTAIQATRVAEPLAGFLLNSVDRPLPELLLIVRKLAGAVSAAVAARDRAAAQAPQPAAPLPAETAAAALQPAGPLPASLQPAAPAPQAPAHMTYQAALREAAAADRPPAGHAPGPPAPLPVGVAAAPGALPDLGRPGTAPFRLSRAEKRPRDDDGDQGPSKPRAAWQGSRW